MIFSAIFLSAGFVVVYAEAKRTNTIQGLDLKYQNIGCKFCNGISLLVLFGFRFFFLCLQTFRIFNRIVYGRPDSIAFTFAGIQIEVGKDWFHTLRDYDRVIALFLCLFILMLSSLCSRNVVILLSHIACMVNNTSQILIPILILVSIVGLSFAYVGSLTNSSSPTLSQGEPWLGISNVEVTPQIVEETGINESAGLLVLQVAPGGPADKAGIMGGNELKVIDGGEIPVGGDVITRIDGNVIRTLDDFRSHLRNKQNWRYFRIHIG